MNLKHQSAAADLNGQSVAADPVATPGAAANSFTLATLIDRYTAVYAGRVSTRAQRLRWWQARLGASLVVDITDDNIFHALEESARRPAGVYVGRDVDGGGNLSGQGKAGAPQLPIPGGNRTSRGGAQSPAARLPSDTTFACWTTAMKAAPPSAAGRRRRDG